MYSRTPSLVAWTPGPSTTRTPGLPAASLPHQQHPAARDVMPRPGVPIAMTPGHAPISPGGALPSPGSCASASCFATIGRVPAASSPRDGPAWWRPRRGGPGDYRHASSPWASPWVERPGAAALPLRTHGQAEPALAGDPPRPRPCDQRPSRPQRARVRPAEASPRRHPPAGPRTAAALGSAPRSRGQHRRPVAAGASRG